MMRNNYINYMSSRIRNIIIIIVALLVIAGVGWLAHTTQSTSSAAEDKAAVTATVTNFGAYLKSIPLTEPTEDLRRDMQQSYTPFVTDALLQQWRADPTHAPGRAVSSPWPDHVVIDNVVEKGESYVVEGRVIMYSSAALANGTDAGTMPFIAQLIKENGTWKIAAFQLSQTTPTPASAATGTEPTR